MEFGEVDATKQKSVKKSAFFAETGPDIWQGILHVRHFTEEALAFQ